MIGEFPQIPELRIAFQHFEDFIHKHIGDHNIVQLAKDEWEKVFKKEISDQEIKQYLHSLEEDMRKHSKKRQHGGMAPIDWTTRAGIYIVPGGVNQDSYAQVPKYVESGFWNPEPGRSYDPVPGQTRFPTSTPAGMGSNLVSSEGKQEGGGRKRRKTLRGGGCGCSGGGGEGMPFTLKGGRRHGRKHGKKHGKSRRITRKLRGGGCGCSGSGSGSMPFTFKGGRRGSKGLRGSRGSKKRTRGGGLMSSMSSFFKQVSMNPVISTTPPNPLQDAQTAWRGQSLGQSPDPTQTKLNYQSTGNSRFDTVKGTVSPIDVDLKNVITTN